MGCDCFEENPDGRDGMFLDPHWAKNSHPAPHVRCSPVHGPGSRYSNDTSGECSPSERHSLLVEDIDYASVE